MITGNANRSASRNAGAAIVDLKDYKSEKGDGAGGTARVSSEVMRYEPLIRNMRNKMGLGNMSDLS
ncbi:hypothetical protein [Peribacillus sp. TH14]|uniref:hypothetical protein n=1 Tax=Peribacillus sp. TH14 TaxID=2798481 RepID=UPI001913D696|nr:hypothetical protein [Peribacillus sp. TH14]MBK5502618.1 hypothetical protein [Peribacillus sp. TH14]